jgi:ppGpp synthetase/RelA/SpoT-type nucleotidyltranferase
MAAAAARLSTLLEAGVLQRTSETAQLILRQKPFESVVNKIYRLNCLWNRSWPEAPSKGWVTHDNCYVRLDDIIRGILTSRYLDGPEQVCREIVEAAKETGLEAWAAPKATDAGYYPWHAYVKMPAQIFIGGEVTDVAFIVEVQTVTLLQSALGDLTHKLYAQRRESTEPHRVKARWDYDSVQFRAEYLGHALHLVDAMIVELRNAQQADGQVLNPATDNVEDSTAETSLDEAASEAETEEAVAEKVPNEPVSAPNKPAIQSGVGGVDGGEKQEKS